MSLWDAVFGDWASRRRDFLKRIELVELVYRTLESQNWGHGSPQPLIRFEQAKADLAEIERLLEEAKAPSSKR